jgi:hypothetical protein
MVDQSNIAMSCEAMAPFSAAKVAPAFLSPCAEHRGNPASSQRSRNQLPKPAAVNGLPLGRHLSRLA